MITLEQFIAKWTGKGIDFDGSFGNQCQDLYRQYVKEVLGFPQSPAVPGAKDNWGKYLPEYYERISNSLTGVPVKGDIMIWGASYGPYGHVAIVTEATVNTFKCFSQNDPTGSLPAIRWYKNYNGTLGWLRPKGVNTSDTTLQDKITVLERDLAEQRQQVSNYVEQVSGWSKKYDECNTQRIEAGASSDLFRKQYNDLVAKLAIKLDTRQEEAEILASVDTAITYEDKAEELDRKIATDAQVYQNTINGLTMEVASLKSQLESLETKIANLPKPTDIIIKKQSIIDIIKKIFGVK